MSALVKDNAITEPRSCRVLFLCTHNSARSILAEGLLNQLGGGRFQGFSAGSVASGRVNPHALATLQALGIDTDGFRSKSWQEFIGPEAPAMDLVITVCANAANELCPTWPGEPSTAHWGYADPSRIVGSQAEIRAAFMRTAELLRERILALVTRSGEGSELGEMARHLAGEAA